MGFFLPMQLSCIGEIRRAVWRIKHPFPRAVARLGLTVPISPSGNGREQKRRMEMNPTLSSNNGTRHRRRTRDPVKLTALLYLREALLLERYEDCAEFIATALEFGAIPEEIRALLEDPRRHPNS